MTRKWTDIEPGDAVTLDLRRDLTITAPLNEEGERCPWPWDPQLMAGRPIGQYHCPFCGAMIVAGIPHLDYAPEERQLTPDNVDEIRKWLAQYKVQSRVNLDFSLKKVELSETGISILQPIGPDWLTINFGETIHRDGYGVFSAKRDPMTVRTLKSLLDLDATTAWLVREGAMVEGVVGRTLSLKFCFPHHAEWQEAKEGDTIQKNDDGTFSVVRGPQRPV